MIRLHQFARTWNIPNLSHFCVKVETYLRMTDLPYQPVATLPLQAPKGKLPFIEDKGKKIADSRFIIAYLKKTYGDPLDGHLDNRQKAAATAVQRLVEEHLFWLTLYTRWQYTPANWQVNKKAIFSGMPAGIRDLAASTYRYLIRRQIHGHGTGRHGPQEIFQLARTDLDALSELLGEQIYFLGSKPTSLDATTFGFLINTLGCPIESPIKDYALQKKNLADYCDRMMAGFFPEICRNERTQPQEAVG